MSEYNNDNLKNALRQRLPEYVNMVTKPDRKAGHNMYKCPLCGSGNHGTADSDGAFHITGEKWYCQACGEGGDIFNLYAAINGMNVKSDFQQIIKGLCDELGVDPSLNEKPSAPSRKHEKDTPTASAAPQINKERAEQIRFFAGKMAGSKAEEYLYSRGFTDNIIYEYNLGYDEEKNAVVIPYPNNDYYTERLIEPKGKNKYDNLPGGAPTFLIHNSTDNYFFVTEGQLDALAMVQAGARNVIASHYPSKVEKLITSMNIEYAIFVADNDEPGKKIAKSMSDILTENGVKNITVFPPKGYKDSNDLLKADPEGLRKFLQDAATEMDSAPDLKRDEEKEKRITPSLDDLGIKTLSSFDKKEMEWLTYGYIPKRQITILCGDGGVGKSALWCNIAAAVSNGTRNILEEGIPFSESLQREPQKVLCFSSEDGVEYVIKDRMEKCNANQDNIYTITLENPKFNDFKFGSTQLEQAIKSIRPELVIFDPLESFVPANVQMSARNQMRNVMNPLVGLGEKYGCSFLIICHSNKLMGVWGRRRVSDSSDIWDISRSALLAGETKEKGIFYVSPEKHNWGEQKPSVIFKVPDGSPVFIATSEKHDREFVSEISAVRSQPAPKEDVASYILSILEESDTGECTMNEIQDYCKACGFSDNSVREAKRDLTTSGKVEIVKSGFGGSFTIKLNK